MAALALSIAGAAGTDKRPMVARRLPLALRTQPSPKKRGDRYQLKQYVCQMLNLFEMAYRFRAEGIMAPVVFGSWVIWIWELCNAPVFQQMWADTQDDLPLNYVPDFRGTIDLRLGREGRIGSLADKPLRSKI